VAFALANENEMKDFYTFFLKYRKGKRKPQDPFGNIESSVFGYKRILGE